MAADWSKTAPIALPALLWTLTSCAQQAPKTTTPSAAAQTEQPSSPQPAEREQRPTTPSPSSSVAQSVSPQNLDGFADEPALKDVFFAPDRADIVGEQALIMRANARWLLTRWLIQNLHDLVRPTCLCTAGGPNRSPTVQRRSAGTFIALRKLATAWARSSATAS